MLNNNNMKTEKDKFFKLQPTLSLILTNLSQNGTSPFSEVSDETKCERTECRSRFWSKGPRVRGDHSKPAVKMKKEKRGA